MSKRPFNFQKDFEKMDRLLSDKLMGLKGMEKIEAQLLTPEEEGLGLGSSCPMCSSKIDEKGLCGCVAGCGGG